MSDDGMTFWEHMGELRRRLIVILVCLAASVGGAFLVVEPAADVLMQPVKDLKFVYLSPPELFMSYLKISILLGLVACSPVIVWQLWLFVKPALKRREKAAILLSLLLGLFFFAAGVLFAFYVVAPVMLNFFLQYSNDRIGPLFSFERYIDFLSGLVLSFGAVFELPVVVSILATLGILRGSVIARSRRYAVLAIFVAAALITPSTDIVSQAIMALPMWLLFELSVGIAKIIERRRDRRIKAEEKEAEA